MDASLKCRRLDPSSIRSVEGDAEWKLYNAGLMRTHFLKYLGCFGSSIPAAVGLMGIFFLQVEKAPFPPKKQGDQHWWNTGRVEDEDTNMMRFCWCFSKEKPSWAMWVSTFSAARISRGPIYVAWQAAERYGWAASHHLLVFFFKWGFWCLQFSEVGFDVEDPSLLMIFESCINSGLSPGRRRPKIWNVSCGNSNNYYCKTSNHRMDPPFFQFFSLIGRLMMVNWILLLRLLVSPGAWPSDRSTGKGSFPAARFMLYPLGFSRTLESCPSCVLALHVTGGGCETWLI